MRGRRGSNRWLAVLAAAACVVLLAGCASAGSGPNQPDPRLDGTWHLMQASDARGEIDTSGYDVTLSMGAVSGGNSLCEHYRAQVTGSIGAIWVRTTVLYTQSACADSDQNDADVRYLRDLDSTRFASIDGDYLTLSGGKVSLVYSKTPERVPSSLLKTTWALVGFGDEGAAAQPMSPAVTVRFLPGYRMLVHSACSSVEPGFTLRGGRFFTADSMIVHLLTGPQCTSKVRDTDEKLDFLLFSSFTAGVTYAAGDRRTTLTLSGDGVATFLPAGG